MSRYSFFELKKRPAIVALPMDVNAPIRSLAGADRFDLPEMAELIDRIERNRLYGRIVVRNSRDQEVAVINMQHGICDRYSFIETSGSRMLCKPFTIHFMRSVHNDRVDMGKQKAGTE